MNYINDEAKEDEPYFLQSKITCPTDPFTNDPFLIVLFLSSNNCPKFVRPKFKLPALLQPLTTINLCIIIYLFHLYIKAAPRPNYKKRSMHLPNNTHSI